MNKTMSKRINFSDSEVASSAGYWWVSEKGYVWSSEVRPAPISEEGLAKGPFDSFYPNTYEGPWLLPKGTLRKQYPVLKDRRVLQEFVRLGKNFTQAGVMDFVNTWGWLGDTFAVLDKSGQGIVRNAEPLASWERESQSMASLWETLEAVRTLSISGTSANERLRAKLYLEQRVEWRTSDSVGFRWPEPSIRQDTIAHRGSSEGPEVLSNWNPGDTMEPARYYVHKEVNRCLREHVAMGVLPFLGSKIRFFPDSLRTALYMHFAFELAGVVAEQRACENPRCPNGGVMFPNRRDQRHCDKRCRELAGYHRRHQGRNNPR